MTIELGDRGTGKTTHQLKTAKPGSLFVWCTSNTTYPKQLARSLGRDDLKIVGFDDLSNDHVLRHCGIRYTDVVLDHYCHEMQRKPEGWSHNYLMLVEDARRHALHSPSVRIDLVKTVTG